MQTGPAARSRSGGTGHIHGVVHGCRRRSRPPRRSDEVDLLVAARSPVGGTRGSGAQLVVMGESSRWRGGRDPPPCAPPDQHVVPSTVGRLPTPTTRDVRRNDPLDPVPGAQVTPSPVALRQRAHRAFSPPAAIDSARVTGTSTSPYGALSSGSSDRSGHPGAVPVCGRRATLGEQSGGRTGV